MTTISLPIPDAPMAGSDFVKSIAGMDRNHREAAALDALLAGHVPGYMREFVPVSLTFRDKAGVSHALTLNVLPDYLSIGTDTDRLRFPLWPLTAQKVADACGCILPTTKMVSIIWAAAAKLPPQPWGPPYDASMMSTDRYVIHNGRIDATAAKLGVDLTKLQAGHKKDTVLCKSLAVKTKSVAIFGWHQPNGKPIQPLYLGHENTYADYSHGNRMVSRECELDGVVDDLARILQDSVLAVGVSDEGALPLVRQPGV
jgi:hypothetical protein